MSKISQVFKNNKAFIAFVTGGDPNIETTEKLIIAMEEAGADIIEIGIPFSDPIAEGIVIQEADERALKSGTTTDKLFDMLNGLKEKVKIPLLFMTYLNPIYTYGKEKFLKNCEECGISGVIVPDMPFEERGELSDLCKNHRIDLISMITPTSNQSDERIKMIAKEADGFLYCVSSLGVTGVRNEIKTDIKNMIEQVKKVSDIPCAVGFGISTPEQAMNMSAVADGIIVGSAIVKIVGEYGGDCIEPVKKYVYEMKKAVKIL
ncbi:MAG: tryptophan synthase subunit alpha [Oscillospiraceae bacterium]|nr:tryptophan synthase subunit alpha [Oscillospiraceae bacterium]